MKIRKLRLGDIKAATKIAEINFTKKVGHKSFREMEAMFINPVIPPQYIVAEEKGEILGFAGFIQSWMDYNIYQILWVNVAPRHQHKGVGKALVQKILDLIRKKKDARLALLTTNKPSFYEKHFGFKKLMVFGGITGKYELMSKEI